MRPTSTVRERRRVVVRLLPVVAAAVALSLCSAAGGVDSVVEAFVVPVGGGARASLRARAPPAAASSASPRPADDGDLLAVGGGAGDDRAAASSAGTAARRRPPPPREPAGVESLFAVVKTVRRRVTTRLVRRRRGGGPGRRDGRSRRRRGGSAAPSGVVGLRSAEKKFPPAAAGTDLLSTADIWRLDDIVAGFSPDVAAALRGPDEARRLAAAKLLLEDDLGALRNTKPTTTPAELRPSEDDGGSTTATAAAASAASRDLVASYPDAYGDLRLLRFLRKDRDQDPASTSVQFREFIRWRADNDIDAVRAAVGREPSGYMPEELRKIEKYFPCNFDIGDGPGDGCPPVLLNAGQWDTAELTRAIETGRDGITIERFLEYWAYVYESIHLRLYENSVRRGEMVYVDEICDLKGLSLRQFSPAFISQVLKPWLSMTQENYPETARRIFFFEPPKIIDIVWRIVTPMVSKNTVKKVQFRRGYPGSSLDFIRDGMSARTRMASDTSGASTDGSSVESGPLYA